MDSEQEIICQLEPGQIVRDRTRYAYSDCVVLRVDDSGVRLARPYAYTSSTETSCPTPLMGCETWEVPLDTLLKHYVLVTGGTFRV